MSSPSPEGAPTARIRVEVPHWAASVTMRDNDLRPVAVTERVSQVSNSAYLGQIEMAVAPGAYEVEVTIDGKSQRKWVLATDDKPGLIHAREWDALEIETAMPLPTAAPIAHSSTKVANVAAKSPTPRTLGTGARISLFATAAAALRGQQQRDFEFDIALIDADGVELPVKPPTARNIANRRWWRAAIDLAPGGYTLKSKVPPPPNDSGGPASYRYHPVYLCPGYNHHLFFRCDGPPDLSTLTMHITQLDQNYDPAQPEAIAADAVLTALITGSARQLLMGSERLEQLLHGEIANPWLGVLAAYGLRDGPDDGLPVGLLDEILDHLQRIGLSDHPDVQVLMIERRGASGPVAHPPMLLAALRRLQRLAVERAGLIADDSPLEKMGTRLVADTAWTAWIKAEEEAPIVVPAPSPQADWGAEPEPVGAEPPPPSSLPPPIPAFAAFPDNAPVFPLTTIDELPTDQAVQDNVTLADHAAIIEAANNVVSVGAVCVPGQGCVDVKLDPQGNKLLDFSAEDVSRLTGVPLDLVVKDLDLLRTTQPGKADPASLERPMQLLAAAILGKQSQAAVEASGSDLPQSGSIESQTRRLREEASRLRKLLATAELADPDTDEIGRLADGFDGFADNLIKRAHLVILADSQNRLRYGNRLLRDRLEVREEGAAAVIERMAQVFAAQTEDVAVVNAAELSPTSPEGRAGSKVEITRRRLQDGTRQIGSIYMIRDLSLPELTPEQGAMIDVLLPQVALTGSLLEFAEGLDRTRHLNRLVALADQLGLLLSQPYIQAELDMIAAAPATPA